MTEPAMKHNLPHRHSCFRALLSVIKLEFHAEAARSRKDYRIVIPAKAGIYFYAILVRATKWIPAFAGMTNSG
jgi:hypothetical protein